VTSANWVEVVAAILVFGGAIVTAYFTARGAAKAADTTREVGLATVDASREDKFIERLQARLDAVEADSTECTKRFEDQRRVIYKLQDRVVILERAQLRDAEMKHMLRGFIRELLAAWPDAGHPFTKPPVIPIGLFEDEEKPS
jgi:hypothetical protein